MKKALLILALFVVGSTVIFTACKKDDEKLATDGTSMEAIALSNTPDMTLRCDNGSGCTYADYEKVITSPLQKSDNCKYIVAGTIEFRLNGVVEATVDYGNGDCDNIATKTIDGVTEEFKLDTKDDKWEWDKVIASPLIKINGCDYIVSGVIELYEKKSGELVATFDYGDGSCDDIVTKITDDGTTDFSLNDYPEWN